MKIIYLTCLLLVLSIVVGFAQTPEQFKYQAVLRDNSGNIQSNQDVSITVNIIKGSTSGETVFSETHYTKTNGQGVINLNIGSINNLGSIEWSGDLYFIEIEVDGQQIGVSQLLSVPYALSSKKAEIADYEKLINKPQLSIDPNILIGQEAGKNILSGLNTIAIGDSTLIDNGTGSTTWYHGIYNSALGHAALHSNTTGWNNTATGTYSLYMNSLGNNNTASGYLSMYFNTAGKYNTAMGTRALYANTIGENNTAIGHRALGANTSANSNTAVGYQALELNTTGPLNAAFGRQALGSTTTGRSNTAIGAYALYYNVTGGYNTAVGLWSGPIDGNSGLTNTGAFGSGASVSASNTIKIGNENITQIGGYVAWSNLSDGRFKTNVKQNVAGLEFILKLRPVTYNWDLKKLDDFNSKNKFKLNESEIMNKARAEKESKTYTGFIAQEVEKAASECGFDFSGIIKPANENSHYNLSYAEFVVPVVKAIQEQQEMIKSLQKQVQELKQLISEVDKTAIR